MSKYGIVVTSHVHEIAEGISKLLKEVAVDVSVTYSGGTDDGGVGSSFEKTQIAFDTNEGEALFCFYDLGSAKMTLEMVVEMSDRPAIIYDTALVESAFTAAVLAQANVDIEEIQKQLNELIIK